MRIRCSIPIKNFDVFNKCIKYKVRLLNLGQMFDKFTANDYIGYGTGHINCETDNIDIDIDIIRETIEINHKTADIFKHIKIIFDPWIGANNTIYLKLCIPDVGDKLNNVIDDYTVITAEQKRH